jgi:hypothetical protein
MIVFPDKSKRLIVVDNIKILYSKIEKDPEGWISFTIYSPIPFDLVEIETIDQQLFKAWFNGRIWEGYKIKNSPPVIKWRRIRER